MQTLAPQRISRRRTQSCTRPSGRAHSPPRPRGVGRASWIRARGGRVGGSGGCLPAGRRKPQGPRARRMRPRPPGARRGSPARRRDAHQASRTASCRGGTIPAGKAPRPTGSAERYSVGSRNSHTPNGPRAPGPRSAPPPRPTDPRSGEARRVRHARCAIRSLTWPRSPPPCRAAAGRWRRAPEGPRDSAEDARTTVASVRLRRTAPSRPAGVLPHLRWGRGCIPIAVAERRRGRARARKTQLPRSLPSGCAGRPPPALRADSPICDGGERMHPRPRACPRTRAQFSLSSGGGPDGSGATLTPSSASFLTSEGVASP